jgi:hypothetical protein
MTTDEADMKKEACWAISNITAGGSLDQLKFIVLCGCFSPMCALLQLTSDPRVLSVCLEGFLNILTAGAEETKAESEDKTNMFVVELKKHIDVEVMASFHHHHVEDVATKARAISEHFTRDAERLSAAVTVAVTESATATEIATDTVTAATETPLGSTSASTDVDLSSEQALNNGVLNTLMETESFLQPNGLSDSDSNSDSGSESLRGGPRPHP